MSETAGKPTMNSLSAEQRKAVLRALSDVAMYTLAADGNASQEELDRTFKVLQLQRVFQGDVDINALLGDSLARLNAGANTFLTPALDTLESAPTLCLFCAVVVSYMVALSEGEVSKLGDIRLKQIAELLGFEDSDRTDLIASVDLFLGRTNKAPNTGTSAYASLSPERLTELRAGYLELACMALLADGEVGDRETRAIGLILSMHELFRGALSELSALFSAAAQATDSTPRPELIASIAKRLGPGSVYAVHALVVATAVALVDGGYGKSTEQLLVSVLQPLGIDATDGPAAMLAAGVVMGKTADEEPSDAPTSAPAASPAKPSHDDGSREVQPEGRTPKVV